MWTSDHCPTTNQTFLSLLPSLPSYPPSLVCYTGVTGLWHVPDEWDLVLRTEGQHYGGRQKRTGCLRATIRNKHGTRCCVGLITYQGKHVCECCEGVMSDGGVGGRKRGWREKRLLDYIDHLGEEVGSD